MTDLKESKLSSENVFGPYLAFVDLNLEVIKVGQNLSILNETLHGEHKYVGEIVLETSMESMFGGDILTKRNISDEYFRNKSVDYRNSLKAVKRTTVT